MPRTTNAAAPALRPMMLGSASGFRVTPCSSAPLRPSAAPTSRPSNVRGTRISRTTVCSVAGPSPVIASITAEGSIDRDPTAMLSRQTTSRQVATATSPAVSSLVSLPAAATSSESAGP